MPLTVAIPTAARWMRDPDTGPAPGCGDNKLDGVLTDRDTAVRVAAEGMRLPTYKVRDAMNSDVVYCFDDDSAERVERVMREKRILRLLVLNRDKHLVGIVTLADLAVRGGRSGTAGEVPQDVSEPAVPLR